MPSLPAPARLFSSQRLRVRDDLCQGHVQVTNLMCAFFFSLRMEVIFLVVGCLAGGLAVGLSGGWLAEVSVR